MTVESGAKLPVKQTLGDFAFFFPLFFFLFSFSLFSFPSFLPFPSLFFSPFSSLFLSSLSLLYRFKQGIQLFIYLPGAVTLLIWTMSAC